jgi:hypothetical protein
MKTLLVASALLVLSTSGFAQTTNATLGGTVSDSSGALIPVSDGRYDIGASTTTYVSPDLVDEVRVIVAPADAETARGSGQIQMSTRRARISSTEACSGSTAIRR